MNAPFAAHFALSIAPTSFGLTGYRRSDAPVVDASGERTGTRVTLACEGELWGSDAADLRTAIVALEAAVLAADGQDVTIARTGGGTVESIQAADCSDGPRARVDYAAPDSGQGANYQRLTITVEATLAHDGGGGVLSAVSRVRTAVDAEGLTTVTTTGRVETAPGTSAAAVVAALIPAAAQDEVLTYDYTVDDDDTVCDYTIGQRELVAALPADGGDAVVAGEKTVTTSGDAHNRSTTVYSYDYTGPYAPTYLVAEEATLRSAGGLLSAQVAITTHGQTRATATFTVLGGRDGGNLVELTESISHAESGPLLVEYRYAGTTPLVVQAATPGYRYVQSGRAVGIGQFPQPPAYAFASANLVTKPIVTSRRDDVQCETTWRYEFLLASEQSITEPSDRADSPGFYFGP